MLWWIELQQFLAKYPTQLGSDEQGPTLAEFLKKAMTKDDIRRKIIWSFRVPSRGVLRDHWPSLVDLCGYKTIEEFKSEMMKLAREFERDDFVEMLDQIGA